MTQHIHFSLQPYLHPTLGEGQVISQDANNVTVDFNGTTKVMIIKFAKLKNEYLRVKAFNKFKTSKLVFVPKSIIIGRGW